VSPSEEAAAAVAAAVWSDSSLKVYFNSTSAVDGSIVESSTRVNICSDDTVASLIEKLRRKNLLNGDDLALNLEGPIPGPVPSDLLICAVLSNLKEQGYDTKTKFRIFNSPRSSRGPPPPPPPRPGSVKPADPQKVSEVAHDANASASAASAAEAAASEAAAAMAAAAAAEAAAVAEAAAAAEVAAVAEATAAAAAREAELKQRQEEERQEMQRQQQLLFQKQQQELEARRAQEEAIQQAELQKRLQAEADAAQRAVIEAAEQARLLKLQEEEASKLRQRKLDEEQKHQEEVEKLRKKQEAEAAALKRTQEEEAAQRKRLQQQREADAAALKLKHEQEAAERKRAASTKPPPVPPKPTAVSPAQTNQEPVISSVKSHWENFGKKHQDAQATNVFSGAYDPTKAKHLKPGDPGYGRPPEGSQSEARAAKASDWVDNEIDKLLKVISENGKSGTDGKVFITFGQLFILYQDISDSLVGIMMRAKKRSRLRYEGDMLWQGVHDAVCITIL
jgi:hypothetical protein